MCCKCFGEKNQEEMCNFNYLNMHILCVNSIYVLVIHVFCHCVVSFCSYFLQFVGIFVTIFYMFCLQFALSHLVALHPLQRTKSTAVATSYSFFHNFSLPQNFCSTFSCCLSALALQLDYLASTAFPHIWFSASAANFLRNSVA